MRLGFVRRAAQLVPWTDVAWRAALAVGMAMVVVYFLLPAGPRALAYQVPGMLAAATVLAAVAFHRPTDRRPWIALALGIALSTTGDWTWVILEANGLEPFPSVADVFYLAGLGLQIGAVFWLLRGRVPGGDRAGLLDALIVAVGAGLVIWEFLMAPVVSESSGSPLEVVVALAYPLLDIFMLGVVARLFLSRGRRMPSLAFLGVALVATLCADFGYALLALNDAYASGHAIDAGWLIGTVMWATAALHPSMRNVAEPADVVDVRLSRARLAILAAASLLAPAVLLLQWLTGSDVDVPVVAGGCVALFLLVIARLAGVVSDLRTTLHERRLLESELERRALHDPLTGLANRALFNDRLEHALAKRGHDVAVLFLDIDDFKTVNDSYGHEAGDQVLRQVAAALSRAVRPADTVARLGGDEFAILLENAGDMYAAGQVAERLLESLRASTSVAGHEHTVGASIGIALESGGSTTVDDLMREADVAMYVAKGKGKGGYTVFEQTTHREVVRGIELRGDLDRAIRDGQFELHYQPVLDLRSGAIVGVEALVRWQHPTRGLLAPMDFIPLAESTGAIVPLGRWIVGEACRRASEWGRQDSSAVTWFMSVNVSSVQLASGQFVDAVRDALGASGLPAERLVLEVTESTRLDTPEAISTLLELEGLGVRLAVDDFGTGYASLSALSRNPFEVVKIDRSFIAAMSSEDRAESLVRGVVELGARLGITLVAEGIEDERQLASLRAMGCTLGQGFYFWRPMRASEIQDLIDTERAAAQPSPLAPRAAPAA